MNRALHLFIGVLFGGAITIGCQSTAPELPGAYAIFSGQVHDGLGNGLPTARVTLVFRCNVCGGMLPDTIQVYTNDAGNYRLQLQVLDHPNLAQGSAKLLFEAGGFRSDSVLVQSIPFQRDTPASDSVVTSIALSGVGN